MTLNDTHPDKLTDRDYACDAATDTHTFFFEHGQAPVACVCGAKRYRDETTKEDDNG